MKRCCGRLMFWIVAMVFCTGLAVAEEPRIQSGKDRNLTNRILTVFDTEKGLPSNEANAIVQTRDGYLWVASYGGLLRYDGWTFFNYSKQHAGLPTSSIRALFEDSKGHLWVGTNAMGVFILKDEVMTPCPAEDSARFQSVRCFAEDAAGNLYVGTTNGLATVNAEGKLVAVDMAEMDKRVIRSLSVDKNGAVWGSMDPGIVFCYRDGKLVYRFGPGDLSPYDNTTVFADGDAVFIGTGKNVMLRLAFRNTAYASDSFQAKTISTGDIENHNALFRSAEGELWVCGDVGYGWFDSAMELHTLNTPERVGFVVSGTQDYEGNVWLASIRGGLYRIAAGKFYTANARAGLTGLSVNAITRAGDKLYVGTDSGLAVVDRNWNPVRNSLTAYMKGLRVRDAVADSKGNLWFCTYSNKGLVRYTPDSGNIVALSQTEGLLSNKVRTALELHSGDLAVGSNGGLDILRNGQVVQQFSQKDGFINPTVLCLLELADGTLLAGSDGQGIYAVRDGNVRVISEANGLSIGTVLRMREDQKAEGVWIAAGDTLFFMDKNQQVRAINAFKDGAGSLFDIQVGSDVLWVLKSDGVRRVSRDDLLRNSGLEVADYGTRSGLHAPLVANSWNMSEHGELYLCTADGISILPLTRQVLDRVPPKTVINSVLVSRGDAVDTERALRPETLVLPKDTRRVTIVFAGLTFGLVPSTIEYALEGFDQRRIQVQAGATNAVSYTNLPGGEYTFHLKAINADGVESAAETTLVLKKQLNYYEDPFFWTIVGTVAVLCAGVAVYVSVRIKTRNLRRRQQEYKDITDQALHTIANTIDAKDSYTNGHSERVADYSREIARRLGMDAEEQEKTYYIALLHDIGKIGIPDAILNKPSPLTDEEYAVMRRHTHIGGEILKNFAALPDIGQGALCHHELYNGQGYPNGIAGENIPRIGRIIGVADAYDAMATKRAYRAAMDRQYIVSELEKNSGVQFDPEIVRIMIAMVREMPD